MNTRLFRNAEGTYWNNGHKGSDACSNGALYCSQGEWTINRNKLIDQVISNLGKSLQGQYQTVSVGRYFKGMPVVGDYFTKGVIFEQETE